MSNIKITIGQFIKSRQNSPDTFEDQFTDASGLPKPENYVLDDLVSPDIEKLQLAQQAAEDRREVGPYRGPQEHTVSFSETLTVPAGLQPGPNIGPYAGPSEVIVGDIDPYSHQETDIVVETGQLSLPGFQTDRSPNIPFNGDIFAEIVNDTDHTTQFSSQARNLPGYQQDMSPNVPFSGDTYIEKFEDRDHIIISETGRTINLPGKQSDLPPNEPFTGDVFTETVDDTNHKTQFSKQSRNLPGYQEDNKIADHYNDKTISTDSIKTRSSEIPRPGSQKSDVTSDTYNERSEFTQFSDEVRVFPGSQPSEVTDDTYNEKQDRIQPLFGNKYESDGAEHKVDTFIEKVDEVNHKTQFSKDIRNLPGFQKVTDDPKITPEFVPYDPDDPKYKFQSTYTEKTHTVFKTTPSGPFVSLPFPSAARTEDSTPTQLEYIATKNSTIADRLTATDEDIAVMLRKLDDGESFAGAVGTAGPLGMPGGRAWDPVFWATEYASNQARDYKPGSSKEDGIDVGKIAYHSATQLLLFLMNRQARTNIWNPLLMFPPPILQDFLLPTLDSQFAVGLGTLTGDTALHEINTLGESAGQTTILGKHLGDRHEAYAKGIVNDTYIDPTKPPFVHRITAGGMIGPQNAEIFKTRVYGAPSQDQVLVENKLAVPTQPGVVTEIDTALTTRNKYYERPETYAQSRKYPDNVPFSMGEMVEEALGNKIPGVKTLIKKSEFDTRKVFGTGDKRSEKAATTFFTRKKYARGMEYVPNSISPVIATRDPIRKDPLYDAHGNDGDISVYFTKDDQKNGFIFHDPEEAPSQTIDDDDAFVPLSFTDLRSYKPANATGKIVKTVYFRPFITSFSEATTPEWNRQSFYGRADPVVIYSSTTRTINLGFKIAAFGPEDVDVIYKKLKWLQSMTYAQYDDHLNLKSGPAVRMRIGDVISNVTMNSNNAMGRHGLSGIIDSLNFEYSTSTWELSKGRKVPMHVDVSLSFTALHDRPIGVDLQGEFGGLGHMKNGFIITPDATKGQSALQDKIIDADGSFRYVGDLNKSLGK